MLQVDWCPQPLEVQVVSKETPTRLVTFLAVAACASSYIVLVVLLFVTPRALPLLDRQSSPVLLVFWLVFASLAVGSDRRLIWGTAPGGLVAVATALFMFEQAMHCPPQFQVCSWF